MSFSDVVTFLFIIAFAVYRAERFDGRFPRAAAVSLAFFLAFLLVYLIGWFNLETAESLAQWTKGMIKFVLHFLFLIAGVALIARRGLRFYWLTLAAFVGGIAANGAYGLDAARRRRDDGRQSRRGLAPAAHRRCEQDQHLRRDRGVVRLPRQRPHRRPEPPRDRGRRRHPAPPSDLPPAREGPPVARPARAAPHLPRDRRPRDAVAKRAPRPRLRVPRARDPLPADAPEAAVPHPARRSRRGAGGLHRAARPVLLGSAQLTPLDGGPRRGHAFHRLLVHPRRARAEPALRARAEHVLRLLRVPDREDELRAALVLRRLVRRVRAGRNTPLRRVHRLSVPARVADAADRPSLAAAGDPLAARIRPLGWGLDRRASSRRWSRTSST